MNIPKLAKTLVEAEGMVLHVYKDSLGYDTIGVGHKIKDSNEKNKYFNGITRAQALSILDEDIASILPYISYKFPFFPSLNDCRQRVIAEMCFNMGIDGVSKFNRMCGYIEEGDFDMASKEMLDSKWARQVKGRAQRLANMMKTGVDPR